MKRDSSIATVAIIPARGGSKRIPRKNVKPFFGQPIIAYSIEAARQSRSIDRVIVSTDDPEIAEVASSYGAEVPFERPQSLSEDTTATLPVIRHALEWLMAQGQPVDYACCLYATAPFVTPELLDDGFAKIQAEAEVPFVFTAAAFAYPIFRALKRNADGAVEMFWPEHTQTRSQDLPSAYHDAGQFYWGARASYFNHEALISAGNKIVELPAYRVQDLDTEDDWLRAECLYQVIQQMDS